ncbi:DUF1676 domain containing protein [Asbolus verrucosus]|uniref:DUF1676 domain containing protein n=1 Tax=Asbolus verrucosus TaxID=1661398 RepID=A0A482VG25_ASBVE|nr:DUF1676 domain containing protein [Asbolus verrucosus]
MYKKLVLLLISVAIIKSEDVYEKCGDRLQCIEQELVKHVDELDKKPSLPILGDLLVLEKTKESDAARTEDDGLVERCVRYLASHELKVKLPDGTRSGRSLVAEARTRKLKKIILPLLVLLKLKAAIVIPVVLSAIALIAFKGLGASLIALAIAGATGLKSLLEGHGSKLTYEVVPQIASHWSRAGFETLPQGYHTIS